MKFVGAIVFASTIAAAWSAALTPGQQTQEENLWNQYQQYDQYLRDRRSSYPGSYYAPAPCGAAPIPVPVPAPAYHLAPPHHAPAYAPALPHALPYGGGYPLYRDADEEMSFSDMDQMQDMSQQQMMFEQQPFGHMPMARYSYGPAPALPALAPAYGGAASASAAAAAALAGINAAQAAPAGPAIGVFPNANVGGCSVPLLLSCSPSIKSGHIVKSHAYGGYGGDSYRGVDDHQLHQLHEDATHEQQAPAHDATSSVPLHQ